MNTASASSLVVKTDTQQTTSSASKMDQLQITKLTPSQITKQDQKQTHKQTHKLDNKLDDMFDIYPTDRSIYKVPLSEADILNAHGQVLDTKVSTVNTTIDLNMLKVTDLAKEITDVRDSLIKNIKQSIGLVMDDLNSLVISLNLSKITAERSIVLEIHEESDQTDNALGHISYVPVDTTLADKMLEMCKNLRRDGKKIKKVRLLTDVLDVVNWYKSIDTLLSKVEQLDKITTIGTALQAEQQPAEQRPAVPQAEEPAGVPVQDGSSA